MRKYQKLIALIIIVFVAVTFVGADFARAQDLSMDSTNQTDEESTKGALIILGVVVVAGLTMKMIGGYRDKKDYEKHLEQGKEYLDSQNYSLAVAKLEQAQTKKRTTELKKLLATAYQGQGEIDLEESDYKAAIKNFTQAKNYRPSREIKDLLEQAQDKYQFKHYHQALEYKEDGKLVRAYQELEKVMTHGSYLDAKQQSKELYNELKELKLKRIAVLDFEDTTYGYGNLGSKVAGLFTGSLLAKDPKFIELIERGQLKSILDEQQLSSTSGLVDSATAQELGNILGVDYLLVGKILSADVDTNTSSQYQEEYDSSQGEYVEKKVYTKKREAYTQIMFKLLDVTTGKVTNSRTIKNTLVDREKYERGESPDLMSENKLFDQVLSETVGEFADLIYDKYEI
ncbi:MAG: CsgG/HfaB family protein [Bacillota bacterium]